MNIGLVVFLAEKIDVYLTRKLDKARAISAGLSGDVLSSLADSIANIDSYSIAQGLKGTAERLDKIARIGPFATSQAGVFVAETKVAYDQRIIDLMQNLVDPEPAPRARSTKKTKLYSDLKRKLREAHVLAKSNEGLESHRVVAGYEVDQGLVADLILKNGAFHVIETVDASREEDAFRKAIADIAVSALVLERARMIFGSDKTKSKIVYFASGSLEKLMQPSLDAAEHQGAELINWASDRERSQFVRDVLDLAVPSTPAKKLRIATPSKGIVH